MSSNDLVTALATYKEKIFKQWCSWVCWSLLALLLVIIGIHGIQLQRYLRMKRASQELRQTIAELNAFITHNAQAKRSLTLLKKLSPYVLPSTLHAALLSISTTIPPQTFLTSLVYKAQGPLVLMGFSHSKKELRIFTKAVTSQQLFPCTVRKKRLSGIVGADFTLWLRPKPFLSPYHEEKEPLPALGTNASILVHLIRGGIHTNIKGLNF